MLAISITAWDRLVKQEDSSARNIDLLIAKGGHFAKNWSLCLFSEKARYNQGNSLIECREIVFRMWFHDAIPSPFLLAINVGRILASGLHTTVNSARIHSAGCYSE
jgi:hypothetical protein